MRASHHPRPKTSPSVRHQISHGLLLSFVMLALLPASLAAQGEREAKKAEADRLNREAAQLFNQGTKEALEQAVVKLLAAAPLYHALDDAGDEGATFSNVGLVYEALGQQQKALEYFKQAVALLHAVQGYQVEAATLGYMSRVYYDLGEAQKALDSYDQALQLQRIMGDRGGEGATLNNIGVLYDKLGEQQKALAYLRQALTLRQAIDDRSGVATTLANMGNVYNDLGEGQQALDYYNQALSIQRAIGDRGGEIYTLNNIGAAYSASGEKQKALDYYGQALELERAVGDHRVIASTLNNMGRVYDALGEKQRALDYYEQALPLLRASGNRSGEAGTLNNIGAVYSGRGDKQKALDYYNQALLIERTIGARRDEASTLNNIGAVYDDLGDKQKALDYYNQSLPLLRAVENRSGEAGTLNNIGVIYSDLGQREKGITYYNQALALNRAVKDYRQEATTLYNIAFGERETGRLDDALAHIESAIDIVESLRSEIGNQALRSSFFATVQSFYELYIDLLMRLHRQQPAAGYDGKALQACERSRARTLLETLAEANADIRQGGEPQLLARERALQQQLNAKARQQTQLLAGPHTDAQAAAAAKEIEALTTEYQQVETQIRRTSPHYAALTQPQPLTLKEIQTQVLDGDTVLLEYSLGTDRSYLWVVTPTGIKSYELPKRAEIEDIARQVYAYMRTPQPADDAAAKRGLGGEVQQQAANAYAQAVTQLSRMLLAPAAALLGRKRLLVVADGALQYVPFAALPAPEKVKQQAEGGEKANQRGGTNAPPLIAEHEIVSLPSASTLAVLRREAGARREATKLLAVLADPVFERTDERLKANADQAGAGADRAGGRGAETRGLNLGVASSAQGAGATTADMRIPRLLATRREADAISALAPPAARLEALNFAANRQAATDPSLADYRFVHFATHGFLDSQHPELSGLLLSMFDEQGRSQDGFLRAHEVFNLKLNADVVVLSACQTGLGKEVKGEGLVGLTRGFMYAGAPRVVVSLWSVNDAATAELMTRFYKGMLVDKLRPAQALQAAQVSMLNDRHFSAPFYWAAFTIQGEWR